MMKKTTNTMALVALFGSVSLAAAAAAPLAASLQSAKADVTDFDLSKTGVDPQKGGPLAGFGACDSNHKAVGVFVDVEFSESDMTALEHKALPKEMWDMTDEQKGEYVMSLSEEKRNALIEHYMEVMAPVAEAFQEGAGAAFENMEEKALTDDELLDRQKAFDSLKADFQKFADAVEAAGVSVRVDITLEDMPEYDDQCKAAPLAPALPGPR